MQLHLTARASFKHSGDLPIVERSWGSAEDESGVSPVVSRDERAARYGKFHLVGVLFYAFVAGAACLAAIGIGMAAETRAPAWATLLFASVLAVSVPLGGVVSYVFFYPGRGTTETLERPW